MYSLSKLLPVPMHSIYGVDDAGVMRVQRCRWWQWRGRVWAVRRSWA